MSVRRKTALTTIFLKDLDKIFSLNIPATDNLVLVENIHPLVTNERLASAFTSFGSVKFAYIIVNEDHDSTGYGVISFNSKDVAVIATKRCKDLKFVITRLPTCVKVTTLKLNDDVYRGLPQMLVNENSSDYIREMTSTARFITQTNQKEHEYAEMWAKLLMKEEEEFHNLKELYIRKKKALKQEIQSKILEDERQNLRNRMRHLDRAPSSVDDPRTSQLERSLSQAPDTDIAGSSEQQNRDPLTATNSPILTAEISLSQAPDTDIAGSSEQQNRDPLTATNSPILTAEITENTVTSSAEHDEFSSPDYY